MMNQKKVVLYALTTCVYCNAIKKMLEDLDVSHRLILADELPGHERQGVLEELKKVNPRCSFPTLVIDDVVITGYKVQEIKDTLGIRTEVDSLFEKLLKINKPKGYLFNNDKETTFELLRGLLTNKDRYGYMACPCRLASGERNKDRDIICPCDYREADVKEFGSCFCGLYVSEDWNTRKITRRLVPERRPIEKF